MPKYLPPLGLSDEERQALERVSRSRKSATRQVERARTILALAAGDAVKDIAQQQGCSLGAVYKRRIQFEQRRLDSLNDDRRTGRPQVYDEQQRGQLVVTAKTHPQQFNLPFSHWTLDRLVRYAHEQLDIPISRAQLGAVLVAEGLKWYQEKIYFTERPDPQFAEKRGRL
jgi:transposase